MLNMDMCTIIFRESSGIAMDAATNMSVTCVRRIALQTLRRGAPFILGESEQHMLLELLAHDDALDEGEAAPAAHIEARHGRCVVDAQLPADGRQALHLEMDRTWAPHRGQPNKHHLYNDRILDRIQIQIICKSHRRRWGINAPRFA